MEEIDIVTNPLRVWKEGIRFIPTLKNGDRTLSGILLSRKDIEDFLAAAR